MILEAKNRALARKGLPTIEALPRTPADYTFMNRLQWGFFSVLTTLRARVNWHRQVPAELRERAARPAARGAAGV